MRVDRPIFDSPAPVDERSWKRGFTGGFWLGVAVTTIIAIVIASL